MQKTKNNINSNIIMILGGYGHFGKRICQALASDSFSLIIAGRSAQKAEHLIKTLRRKYPQSQLTPAIFDIHHDLPKQLEYYQPNLVINTCGPFRKHDYQLIKDCIQRKIHYIDLADSTKFVTDIYELDSMAKASQSAVITGASTVPSLSSAVVDAFQPEFTNIDKISFGISPGQKTPRGLATTQSILSYIGKRLIGNPQRFGWQNIYRQNFPEIGHRWMANCDIPDLVLFPTRYDQANVYFGAGIENPVLHWGLWLSSWLIRCRLPINLEKHASTLLKLSHFFDRFGSHDGGMHVSITGTDKHLKKTTRIEWYVIAKSGDGPQIPATPAVILAKKIIQNPSAYIGASPCVGLISLDEYLQALKRFDIDTFTKRL